MSFYYWLATSLAISASGLRFQSKPLQSLPPSQDPFYSVPADIDAFSPGQIISHREPPSQISTFGWIPAHLQKAHQILYRTTDSRQQPTVTVLTALIPPNADYGKVVSLQMAEDAATIDCAPSYTMQRPAQSDPLLRSNLTEIQLLFAEAALARKWIVVVPDYEGPLGSFAASKITGHAILDGVRAATQSGDITGIKPNARIILWGYSGAASATQAAITIQELYAPELEIAGAAMGGLPSLSDASAIFNINKGPSAALIPNAMIGLASQHPELKKHIDQSLKPQYRDIFYSPLHQCLQQSAAIFSNQDILAMFYNESIPGLIAEVIQAFREEIEHPLSKITVPLYVYQSAVDRISPIENIDAMIRSYCQHGISVTYERANSANVSHLKYGIIGVSKALSWIEDRLDGIKAPQGCVNHTDTTSTLDSSITALYPENINKELIRILNAA